MDRFTLLSSFLSLLELRGRTTPMEKESALFSPSLLLVVSPLSLSLSLSFSDSDSLPFQEEEEEEEEEGCVNKYFVKYSPSDFISLHTEWSFVVCLMCF